MGKSSKPAPHGGDRPSGMGGTGTFRSPSLRGAPWRSWASAGAWFALTILVMCPVARTVEERAGKEADAGVRAPLTFSVNDVDANAAETERIERNPERIWVWQTRALPDALDQLHAAFEVLQGRKPETGADVQQIARDIYDKARIRLSNEEISLLYREANVPQMRENLDQIAEKTLDSRIIVKDEGFYSAFRKQGTAILRGAPAEFEDRVRQEDALDWPEGARRYLSSTVLRRYYPLAQEKPVIDVALRMLMDALGPNLDFDRAASDARQRERLAQAARNPIAKLYTEGDWIAREGEELTETQALALHEVNLLRVKAAWRALGGVAALAAICFAAVAVYLGRLRLGVALTPSNISMLAAPVLLALAFGRLLGRVQIDFLPDPAASLFPTALVGMVSAIMIGPQAGFILVIVASLLFGLAEGREAGFLTQALLGGFTAVVSLRSIRERRDVWVAGFRVGLVSLVAAMALSLFRPSGGLDPWPLAATLGNGVACALVAWPLLYVFEWAFGVVTDIRLLEITGPQHPLIKMMEEKSPGTYQHVLNVTKLAESAAEEIGANFLLVRAGAYFHDVGKALQPKYFTENQVTLEDKKLHPRLSPYMSTLIIKNHVKQGIELAKKYKLPSKVADFIPQHHGTSLIRYFYAEAMRRYEESETTEVVREEDFRYPGPKPQTIEAGIVLLADSIEAIVTAKFTATQVNEHEMRRVVAAAISERFNDGQFDECDLTMRDLFLIRESFIRTLKARFHHRIDYPGARRTDQPQQPQREARDRGDRDSSVSIAVISPN